MNNNIKKKRLETSLAKLMPTEDLEDKVLLYEKNQEKLRRQEAAYLQQRNVELSGVPKRYWHDSFETYFPRTTNDERNFQIIKKFSLLQDNDKVLLILGAKGLGKTHLGSAVIRQHGGLFISIEELIFKYDSSMGFQFKTSREEIMNRYSSTKMLVIDEIGRSIQKSKENALLNYLLRRRYENVLPTVLISNLDKNSLLRKLGDAVLDRLKETCITVEFLGNSYRPSKRDVNL